MPAKKTAKQPKQSSLTENAILMMKARETLKGQWGIAVTMALIWIIITFAISLTQVIGFLVSLVITGPLTLGLTMFWLNFSRGKAVKIEMLFSGFDRFKTSFIAHIIMTIFILLWALLLIIPGIVAALSYSMTYFILADDKNIDGRAAIQKSKKMMYGHKWKLFCLFCRFIGWFILCILTLGIGFLWLIPYISVSTAKFYEDVKGHYTPE